LRRPRCKSRSPHGCERGVGVPLDSHLHDLLTQSRQQCTRAVQRDDATFVNDGDPVAEPFGFVQVMGCEHGRHARSVAEPADQVE
jgi:hypothetical protein